MSGTTQRTPGELFGASPPTWLQESWLVETAEPFPWGWWTPRGLVPGDLLPAMGAERVAPAPTKDLMSVVSIFTSLSSNIPVRHNCQ